MPNPNDPLIVQMLEARAIANATDTLTGRAADGDISVHHYPVCGRRSWFSDREGPISKQRAVDILTRGLWNPKTFAGPR